MIQPRSISGRPLSGRVIDGRTLGARGTSSGGAPAFPSNAELREDGSFELREDGGFELREDDFETESITLLSAMSSRPSVYRGPVINRLIASLKSAGVWTRFDRLGMVSAADSQAALLDWIHPSGTPASVVDVPTFVADAWYSTDGSNDAVNTGFDPATDGVNFTQNTHSFGFVAAMHELRANSAAGWFDGTDGITITARSTSDLARFRSAQVADSTTAAGTVTDGRHCFALNRSASGATQHYIDGVASSVTVNANQTSTALNSNNLYLGRSATATFTAGLYMAWWAGGSFTAAEHAAIAAAIYRYLDDVGATLGKSGSYNGFSASFTEDFDTLDIVGPGAPTGRWFPTRNYIGAGLAALPPPRGGMSSAPGNRTDPLWTGYNDSNRGVAIGYDNVRVSGSVIALQARAATVGEKAHFLDPTNNKNLQCLINSSAAIVFNPGSGGDILVEGRLKFTPVPASFLAGAAASFWTISATPTTELSGLKDEIDILECVGTNGFLFNVIRWNAGVDTTPLSTSLNNEYMYDGQFHTISLRCIANGDLRLYSDGFVYQITTQDPSPTGFPQQVVIGTGINGGQLVQADWDTSGTTQSSGFTTFADWIKVWRASGLTHYAPLQGVSDVSVAYNASGSVVLPSKTALWGDANVTEYVQCIPYDLAEPGETTTATFSQFPTGVSYNSGTRTITADFTAGTGNAGRLHVVVYAYSGASTCAPLRFVINRGPNISTASITSTVNLPMTYDLYPECDVGIMTPKIISVSGLPTGVSHDGAGVVSGTPTSVATTPITITCTNNAGQQKQVTINFVVSAAANVAVTFDGTNDYMTRGAGLTGAADSKLLSMSFWIKSGADGGSGFRLLTLSGSVGGAATLTRVSKGATNAILVTGYDSSDTKIAQVDSTNGTVEVADGWLHILCSFDLANSSNRHFYIDDAADGGANWSTYTNAAIDFTKADCAFGGNADGALKTQADIYDFWYAPGVYIDFSVTANRRKFISAGGNPVSLGADGSTPTGSAPLIFLSGALASWNTNNGTGGGFTLNGALTQAGTNPP